MQNIVMETRENWIDSFRSLLAAIAPPKVLFWFAQRGPVYSEQLDDVHRLFGSFPQLVNRAMMEHIWPLCDQYVECVSSRGMPQALRHRFTGEPALVNFGQGRKGEQPRASSHNSYYPSPQIQLDAARGLHGASLKYL